MAISGFMNALQTFQFFLRGISIAGQGVELGKKLYYNYGEQWEGSDYLEVATKVSCIVADGVAMHADLNITKLEGQVKELQGTTSDLTDQVSKLECLGSLGFSGYTENTKKTLKATKVTLDTSKTTLQQTKNISAMSSGLGAITHIVSERASGKPIQEILTSAPGLIRIGAALGSAGSAWSDQYPQLALKAKGASTVIETGVLAKGAYSASKELIITANYLYQRARNAVTRNNQTLALDQPPLTVPPTHHQYNAIPDGYDEDPVFSQYECPITNHCIRYPVAIEEDNGTTHYYELAAIYEWVKYHGNNPLTRNELKKDDLRVDLNAQRAIEDRMRALGIPLK